MRALKPYPSYRDSGLPWLGATPRQWEVVRSKYLLQEIDDRTDTGTETLLSMRQAHGLIPHDKVSTKPVTPEELKGYKRVRAGQLVLNRMQASNGMFAVAREDGLVSPDYAVFRPLQPMEPNYFVDLFKTNIYRAKFRQESKGLGTGMSGFLRLYSDRFGAIHVPQPPEDEQRKIVQFIRVYDHHVRRLIRNKRRLIGLLNEQKQAIINQAVTRGLNPTAPMKPTGIDWMPEVPAHWNLKRLKFLSQIPSGQVDPRIEEHRNKVLIAPNHISAGSGTITEFVTAHEQGADSGKYEVRRGDVVYSKIRPHLRKAAISPIDGLCSADMYPIIVKEDEISSSFFLHLLLSHEVTRYAVDCSMRVAMPKINRDALGNCWLWYPPFQEQLDILKWIDRETGSFDAAIRKPQKEIGLLREYRDRLIADIVTGKLDVRHVEIAVAAEAPAIDDAEESDELETDDAEVMEDVEE